jgi:hypothetical protein
MPAAAIAAMAVATAYAANKNSSAAKSAANTQAQAAHDAAGVQQQQFEQMQQNLSPYMEAGKTGLGGLLGVLGLPGGVNTGNAGTLSNILSTPFSFNPSDLENTPGYQFTREQGLKALNNQNSSQGLGLSGAQQKGLLQYATGLANQTYGDQYNRALQQFTTNYGLASDQANRLAALVGMGQSSAAGVGNAGIQTGSNIGNLLTGAANAQAAGRIGSANAISSGIGGLSNAGLLYSMLNNGNMGMAASGTGNGIGGIYGGQESAIGTGNYAGYA